MNLTEYVKIDLQHYSEFLSDGLVVFLFLYESFDLKPHSRSFFGGNVQLINDEEETYLVSRRRTVLAYVLIEKGLMPRLPSSDFEWIKDQEKSLKGKKDSAKLSIDSILLRNFESKLEEDLISLNNLLFIQHRKFIETMPFEKSDSSPNKCLFDAITYDHKMSHNVYYVLLAEQIKHYYNTLQLINFAEYNQSVDYNSNFRPSTPGSVPDGHKRDKLS